MGAGLVVDTGPVELPLAAQSRVALPVFTVQAEAEVVEALRIRHRTMAGRAAMVARALLSWCTDAFTRRQIADRSAHDAGLRPARAVNIKSHEDGKGRGRAEVGSPEATSTGGTHEMNMALIKIIIALGPVIPTLISDLDTAYKQVQTDAGAQKKVQDTLAALGEVASLIAKAL